MNNEYSQERLAGLLADPREAPDFEIKSWLDLESNNEDKATLAKAVLALANHGGGFIVLGLSEMESGIVEAEGRPATLDGYSQEQINGVVQSYCDPQFHCAVHIVPNPEGSLFPIVVVPGGHRVPVRVRRAGPHENIVQNHAIYIRKPGPRSETPQSAQDWDELLARCLNNRRDEMFDQIRDLITGAVPQAQEVSETDRLSAWMAASVGRWKSLIHPLPADAGPSFPNGSYQFSYEIIGDMRATPPAKLPEIIRESVVRHTGWPPFWYPTRERIAPYLFDGSVECWLGGDSDTPVDQRDPAHSDFWRIHPDGLAFLLRGFQEDGADVEKVGRKRVEPGTIFDVTLPVWRTGETLLQARSLAKNLCDGPATVRFSATYSGLSGRTLTSLDGRRALLDGRTSRQNTITLDTHVDLEAIDANLPEIVHPLLSPLYSLFDFFDLPKQLVVDETARMRSGRF